MNKKSGKQCIAGLTWLRSRFRTHRSTSSHFQAILTSLSHISLTYFEYLKTRNQSVLPLGDTESHGGVVYLLCEIQSLPISLCSHFTCFCAGGRLNIHPQCHPQQRQAYLLGTSCSPLRTRAWVHTHTRCRVRKAYISCLRKTDRHNTPHRCTGIHIHGLQSISTSFCTSQNVCKQLAPPVLSK